MRRGFFSGDHPVLKKQKRERQIRGVDLRHGNLLPEGFFIVSVKTAAQNTGIGLSGLGRSLRLLRQVKVLKHRHKTVAGPCGKKHQRE